jgi:long-chain fatty acid transport protein
MRNSLFIKVGWYLFLFFVVCNSSLYGGGFQIYQAAAPDAMALGAATVARDDLVSSAWYNPAAVTGFTESHYNSGYALAMINWQYEPGNGVARIKVKDQVQVVPGSHLIHPINDRYTAAFSLYTPFGLGMRWNDDDVRRLMDSGLYADPSVSPPGMLVSKGLTTQAELKVPYFNSTIATRLSYNLAVAAGFSIIKADFKMRFLSRGIILPATVAWDSFIKYQAEGWGVGYVLAAHYKCGPEWKFGVRYLSDADVKLKGTVEDHPEVGLARMKGTLKLPDTLTFGAVNTSFDRWILSCDVMRTGWSRYDRLVIEPRDAGQTKGGFSTEKNWKDTYSYRFGAEYNYNSLWKLRGGYVYDNSPVPQETRNMELPADDGHIFSLGASRDNGRFIIDLGYSYMILKKGAAGSVSLNSAGEFTGADNHFLMISCSRKF